MSVCLDMSRGAVTHLAAVAELQGEELLLLTGESRRSHSSFVNEGHFDTDAFTDEEFISNFRYI